MTQGFATAAATAAAAGSPEPPGPVNRLNFSPEGPRSANVQLRGRPADSCDTSLGWAAVADLKESLPFT